MDISNLIQQFGIGGVMLWGMYILYKDMNAQQKAREEKLMNLITLNLKVIEETVKESKIILTEHCYELKELINKMEVCDHD